MTGHQKKISDWSVGQSAELSVEISEALVDSFALHSGDRNPLHLDEAFAERTQFKRRVAHGMSYASLFSRLVGMDIPGRGGLWLSQSFEFHKPTYIGDTLVLRIEIEGVNQSTNTLTLSCSATNQFNEQVLAGTGKVMLLEQEEEEPDASLQSGKKVAIVTGGSRGIGAAIVSRLVADGYAVVFTYRSSDEEAAKIAEANPGALAIRCDSADISAMRDLFSAVKRQLGIPTAIVLNAGDRNLYGSIDTDPDVMLDQFRTQVLGPQALVAAAVPDMAENGGGSIVAVGSAYAVGRPPEGMTPYVTAKSALSALINCLAIDCGKQNIRANLVVPGMTETALLASVPSRTRKVMAAQNPMRRLGRGSDVAGAVAFLVSEDAAYINGEQILLTGGGIVG